MSQIMSFKVLWRTIAPVASGDLTLILVSIVTNMAARIGLAYSSVRTWILILTQHPFLYEMPSDTADIVEKFSKAVRR
jgi:hypothetical protein